VVAFSAGGDGGRKLPEQTNIFAEHEHWRTLFAGVRGGDVIHGGPTIYRNRLACGRIQCGLTQNINIALAGFRKLDDRSGDCFIREVGSAYNSRTSNFECDAHETLCLGIEPVTD
jgi:hypothetical protein